MEMVGASTDMSGTLIESALGRVLTPRCCLTESCFVLFFSLLYPETLAVSSPPV